MDDQTSSISTSDQNKNEFSLEELRGIAILPEGDFDPTETLGAINELAREFGKKWVQLAKLRTYIDFVDAWRNWSKVQSVRGSDKIKRRWQNGFDEQGILSELRIFSALQRTVHDLELYPASNERELDCRFRSEPGSRWVYVEISKRDRSKLLMDTQAWLTELAACAHKLAQGRHAHIAILREISDDEYQYLMTWLNGSPADMEMCRDYARFGITQLPRGDSKPLYDKEWANAVMHRDPSHPCTWEAKIYQESVGTAYMVIDDSAIERYFSQEAEQLQRGEPGVLLLDLSDVQAGIETCAKVVRRRLQPAINTRVSAVGLYQTFIKNWSVQHYGRFLTNTFARFPLTQAEVGSITAAFV